MAVTMVNHFATVPKRMHRGLLVRYSRKIWRGIKFGGLAVYITTTKLKSAKISYLHICMEIPYQTTKFKSANILAIAILGSTANLIPANISSYTVLLNFVICFIIILHQ